MGDISRGLAEMRGEVEMQPAFAPNNDAQIAYDIRGLASKLNARLFEAAEAGLILDVAVAISSPERKSAPSIGIAITRKL